MLPYEAEVVQHGGDDGAVRAVGLNASTPSRQRSLAIHE
jgi:hypothetical protein